MKRRLFLIGCTFPLLADANLGRVDYVGGTIQAFPNGTEGNLRTTDKEYLTLVTKKAVLRVLYDRVNLLEYGQTVSRRYALAVLISPVLILSKKRRHYLTLGYKDDEGKQQAMVFLVDKSDIRALLASLEARTGVRVEFQDQEARKQGRG